MPTGGPREGTYLSVYRLLVVLIQPNVYGLLNQGTKEAQKQVRVLLVV